MTDKKTPGDAMTPQKSLRRRILTAGSWTLGGFAVERALRLGSNLVMTRLLAPEAFGLISMVVAVQLLVDMISDIGIRQSVVRHKDGEDPHFLRVAWTVQILRSGVVAGLVVLAALGFLELGPLLAAPDNVYADPMLPGLVLASALPVLMRGAASVNVYLAARRLHLGRAVTLDICDPLISIPAMILFAQIEASAWALMAGMLVGAAVRLALSHILFPQPRMRLTWDSEIADELWRFGRWLIGASLAGFVARNGDRFILGALLSKTDFGFYAIAAIWVQTGAVVLTKLADQVIFASVSELYRTSAAGLRRVLGRLRLGFDALCVAGFLVAFFLGSWFVELLYPPAYAAAGAMISLLAFRLLALRYLPLGAVLLAAGDSRSTMYVTMLRALWMLSAPIAAWYALGLDAMLIAAALTPLAGAPLLLRRVAPHLGGRVLRTDYAIMAAILAAGLAAAALHLH
jgi:O-antigen/teichoic acid export membrane protein